jgi:hypothetical protein
MSRESHDNGRLPRAEALATSRSNQTDDEKPQLTIPAQGYQKKLIDQRIADVIAYVISLSNP